MEKLTLTSSGQEEKKVFLRKEMDDERLGEEIYEDELLSPYSVYLVRKFDYKKDYQELSEMQDLLEQLPEIFNEAFEAFVIKKIYVRHTPKSIYVSLLLALAQPLTKEQMLMLRRWMTALSAPEKEVLEHVSAFSNEPSMNVAKDLRETNSEVLLLSEMMNQFNRSLAEVNTELQAVKKKRTPPVVKVVQSEVATRKALTEEYSQELEQATKKIDALSSDFILFKKEITEQVQKAVAVKPRKPPKFKLSLPPGVEGEPTLEQRLTRALKKIEELTKIVDNSTLQVTRLEHQIAQKTDDSTLHAENHALSQKWTVTNEEVLAIGRQLKQINSKLTTMDSNLLEASVGKNNLDSTQQEQVNGEVAKLTQSLLQVSTKLEKMETELTTVSAKKVIPKVKLTKSNMAKELSEQHKQDQEQLKLNAKEIKQLTQTVGKVDVQLIKAHQKIAELEQSVRKAVKSAEATPPPVAPKINKVEPTPVVAPANPVEVPAEPVAAPVAPTPPEPVTATRSEAHAGNKSDFPSKEAFLKANTPQRPTVTLAIEEMLERVSDNHPVEITQTRRGAHQEANDAAEAALSQKMEKLEEEIFTAFTKNKTGRGMIRKDGLKEGIQEIAPLPEIWASIYRKEPKDVYIKKDLSCRQLVAEFPVFLDEITALANKRSMIGKWISCPKDMELDLEGYKLLTEYLIDYQDQQRLRNVQ